MHGAIHDLDLMLRGLEPVLRPQPYAMVLMGGDELPAGVTPAAIVREDEGLSAVLTEAEASALGLEVLYRGAWITLRVHSDLAAVGLTAAVSAALAQAGLSCNMLAGAYHDHLLVPWERADDAMSALHALQRAHAG